MALIASDGTLLSTVRGPGLPQTISWDESLSVLDELVGLAQRRAGGYGLPLARHTSACIANLDLPEEEDRFARALRQRRWSTSTSAVNDTFAVLRSGLDETNPAGMMQVENAVDLGRENEARSIDVRPRGAAIVCGAGINCVGLDPSGRTARFLAFGDLTGDWGGGNDLGRAALWWATRAEDGRGPETALRKAVASHFGVPSVRDVAVGIRQGVIETQRIWCPSVWRTSGSS